MNRDDLIDEFRDAMDNRADYDTSLRDYAAAAVDRLGWRDLQKEKPDNREMVIATDGKARWMDMWIDIHDGMTWASHVDRTLHVATYWHPILDLPDASTLKSPEQP